MLIVLVVVFVGLLAVLIIQGRQASTTQEFPFERVFDEFSESDIMVVRLHDPHSESAFTLSRGSDGRWTSPDHVGEVDQEIATLIARTIITLPYDNALPITEETDLTEYGFAEIGVFAVDVILTNGNSHGLLIGSLAPSNTVYYALADDRNEIYPVYRGAIDYLVSQYTTPPLA
jgi:hypothetical protein